MANNVTQISGATPIEFYLGNYAYADILTDMEILQFRLDTAGSERIIYKNAAGAVFKIMTDASAGTNAAVGSIFFADSVGACSNSANLLFINNTIKLNNLTGERVIVINADKELTPSDITVTELNALDEVTGNIQAQINALGQISGTENYLVKYKETVGIEESIMYDDGTKIGIGTTTPAAILHIAGAGAPLIKITDDLSSEALIGVRSEEHTSE